MQKSQKTTVPNLALPGTIVNALAFVPFANCFSVLYSGIKGKSMASTISALAYGILYCVFAITFLYGVAVVWFVVIIHYSIENHTIKKTGIRVNYANDCSKDEIEDTAHLAKHELTQDPKLEVMELIVGVLANDIEPANDFDGKMESTSESLRKQRRMSLS